MSDELPAACANGTCSCDDAYSPELHARPRTNELRTELVIHCKAFGAITLAYLDTPFQRVPVRLELVCTVPGSVAWIDSFLRIGDAYRVMLGSTIEQDVIVKATWH